MDIKKELGYRASDAETIIYHYLPKEVGYQKVVFEAMNYSVMVGGKRIRPILMQETYKLFGGTSQTIQPFMAAIEMIHTYSLVHDDLPAMDNDLLRRGQPTTHAKFGEAMGVLAGDGLLNYAFEVALTAVDMDEDNTQVVKAAKVLAAKAGIFGMIGGQVVDVESEKEYGISKSMLDFIYKLKTGALIEAAMMIGAILAGASDEDVERVEEIASKVGLAFQIQDDILDVEGDAAKMGKDTGSDAKNNKATYVVFEGIDRCKQDVSRLTEEAIASLKEFPGDSEFLEQMLRYMITREN